MILCLVAGLTGCQSLKNCGNKPCPTTEYIFPGEPVYVQPESPMVYQEALEVIAYYDQYSIDLELYIFDMKKIIRESGAVIHEPETTLLD